VIVFWNYWLDSRAWGLGRPLLLSLPLVYLTWEAIGVGSSGLGIVALVLLWVAVVQEWVKWRGRRTSMAGVPSPS
jgi:hypothetical protein